MERRNTSLCGEYHDGFALPVILLVGISLIAIGLSGIQVVTSVRDSLEAIHLQRLSTEAAEAGLVYAGSCLEKHGYIQSWGPAQGRPNLTQTTDCTGAPLDHTVTLLSNSAQLRIRFVVSDVVEIHDDAYVLTVLGVAERINMGSGAVTTTSTKDLRRIFRSLGSNKKTY